MTYALTAQRSTIALWKQEKEAISLSPAASAGLPVLERQPAVSSVDASKVLTCLLRKHPCLIATYLAFLPDVGGLCAVLCLGWHGNTCSPVENLGNVCSIGRSLLADTSKKGGHCAKGRYLERVAVWLRMPARSMPAASISQRRMAILVVS